MSTSIDGIDVIDGGGVEARGPKMFIGWVEDDAGLVEAKAAVRRLT